MKISMDIDDSLYEKIVKNAKINERSVGAEVRYHLKNILG